MKRALFGLLAFCFFACQANFSTAATIQIFLTANPGVGGAPITVNWTVPSDWNGQDNTIEAIGPGGDGNDCGGTNNWGGGGGAYAKISKFTATPGSTISVVFTVNNNSSGVGGNVAFNSSSLIAAGGHDGCASGDGHNGQGGQASASTGTTKFSGGDGAFAPGGGSGTGPGGGAAGPHGAGGVGNYMTETGGAADAGFGGAGGVGAHAQGGAGTEYDGSHGAGGGGGSTSLGQGGAGGLYGGGGGYQSLNPAPALIIITYTPHRRVSSGVF